MMNQSAYSIFPGLVIFLLYTLLVVSEVLAADHCVILQYHHFGVDTPRSTSVTPEEFDAHLNYLGINQYNVWPLVRVVEYLRSNKPLPQKCVAITIDDAYISVYTEAFPRLRRRGWPFTVFINGAQADHGSKAFMTWEQMREMAGSGVRFENHSFSHAHLIRHRDGESESEWQTRVKKDISAMQLLISEKTGQQSQLFAYPFGEYDEGLKDVVAGLGLTGFGQQSGPAWVGSDFLALPRFPMAADYALMPSFITKVRSLPLPVIETEPEGPLLPLDEWRPILVLRLGEGNFRREQLSCYVSGQGEGELVWRDKPAGLLEIRAKKPLNVGRSRYNCTAPSIDGKRYYWYSHSWIRRHKDGSWYKE